MQVNVAHNATGPPAGRGAEMRAGVGERVKWYEEPEETRAERGCAVLSPAGVAASLSDRP
jgi:hypothetical protein